MNMLGNVTIRSIRMYNTLFGKYIFYLFPVSSSTFLSILVYPYTVTFICQHSYTVGTWNARLFLQFSFCAFVCLVTSFDICTSHQSLLPLNHCIFALPSYFRSFFLSFLHHISFSSIVSIFYLYPAHSEKSHFIQTTSLHFNVISIRISTNIYTLYLIHYPLQGS